MSDIVERLNRAGDLAIPGEPCGIYYDAANEIERLRLTDEEREAIESAVLDYEQNDDDADCARMVSTLRGMLDRTKDGGK